MIDVNKGFEHLTGYALDEIVGKSSLDLGLLVKEERIRLLDMIQHEGVHP